MDLDNEFVYAKERRLLDEVKAELKLGRKCQVFAVYTQKRDVTQRLKRLFANEGIQTEVLTTDVPPEKREAWYEDRLRRAGRPSPSGNIYVPRRTCRLLSTHTPGCS